MDWLHRRRPPRTVSLALVLILLGLGLAAVSLWRLQTASAGAHVAGEGEPDSIVSWPAVHGDELLGTIESTSLASLRPLASRIRIAYTYGTSDAA
jgi:hypothetical protein